METGTPQPASIISSAAFTLTHTGGADHQNVFMAVLTYVSATNPVIAFRSAVTNCVNVIAADERDIGGPATLTLV
jgi:hypothetical protein